MTNKQVYELMLTFLERYADGNLDLTAGELLGSLAIDSDGIAMDARATEVWQQVCNERLTK
jgi:hypothetical protein